jgi:DHA1 family tetracycline resistance protein-like MFS transporter
MAKSRLTTIFLIVFVDILGFGLILPLLPYYAETYGATAWITGLLVASYAAAQLIGAPLLGRLSDRFGRRPVLLLSILGTAVGFLILALAEPIGAALGNIFGAAAAVNGFIIAIMFFSRILDGVTGGNISVAQAYITDVTDSESRAKGLGLLGAAFGFGFIIGPATGGLLSTWGYAVPAYAAAALATLNLLAVYFYLPESLTAARRAEIAAMPRPSISLDALVAAFRRPRVGPILHTRFFYGLAFAMFTSIFSLYAAGGPLNLSPQSTGFVLAYVGLLSAIVQGFAIGKLAKRYPEPTLMLSSAVAMVVGFFLWGLVPNVLLLLIVLLPLSIGGGVMNTILSSVLTKAVPGEAVGGTLGLATAVESSTRVIAPALGGFLLGQFGVWGPALFSGLLMLWVSTFIWRRFVVNPDPPLDNTLAGAPPSVAISH